MDEYRIVSILDNDFHLKATESEKAWMNDIYAKPVFYRGRAFANHLLNGCSTSVELVTSPVIDIICNTDEIIQFKTENSFYTFLKL